MGSTTTKYAFPYPIGTDRVMDGDNAIQALAQRVEDVMAGNTGMTRFWGMQRTQDDGFPGDGGWKGLLTLALTGLPVGGVVVAVSNLSVNCTTAAGTFVQNRITCTAGTAVPASPFARASIPGVQWWTHLNVVCVITATGASPSITQEAMCSAGTATTLQGSHLVAYRII